MRSSWMKLLAALMAFAMIAAACGDDDDGGSNVAAGLEDAQAAQAAAEEAQAEAEAAQAEAEQRAADAEEAAAMAEEEAAAASEEAAAAGGDTDDRPYVGEIIRVTGPERSPEEWGGIQDAFDAFAEETGMTIIYTGSADWEAEVNVQVAAGNPPDISMFPQPGKMADFAREGILQPLPDDVLASVQSNWGEAPMAFGLVDGAQVGVPAANNLKSLVWHKPAVFEANGYAIPQTWDELLALTDTMIADGITPWCVGIESGQATGWVFTDWTEDLMLRFAGAEAYDQWVANDLKFSDPIVTDIFGRILDLWNTDGAVFAGGGSISTTHHSSDNAEGLAADDCAMVRQASFFSGFLPAGTSTDVDVFYFPSIDENRPVLGAGTLAGAFNDRPAVMAVMDYIGSPTYAELRQASQKEALGGAGQLSGFNTANLNVDTSLWEPLEQSFIEILQTAAVFRFDGSDLMPADVGAGTFWTEATAMVNGEKTPEEAAAAIDASWPTE